MDFAVPLYLPAQESTRQRLEDDGSWLRTILDARHQGGPRLALVDLEGPGRLPPLPGCARELVLLAGQGARLLGPAGAVASLAPPYGRARLEGAGVAVEPETGALQLFELAWPEAVEASVLHRPLVGALYCFTAPGTAWAIHLLAGAATIVGQGLACRLERGDSAWLPAGPRQRYLLDGGGEALLVRLDTAQPPQ